MWELDRTAADFRDEQVLYRCSCGAFSTSYPEHYSLCPCCGAPIEDDEAEPTTGEGV